MGKIKINPNDPGRPYSKAKDDWRMNLFRSENMKKCDRCLGLGGIQWQDGDHTHWEYCDACNGTGEVEDNASGVNQRYSNKQSIYKRAVDLWGQPAQINMAIEECAELIKELVKLGRYKNGSDEYEVAEEIADVEIMLEQLRYIFGEDKVVAAKKRKLERLLKLVQYGEGTA